MEKEEPEKQPTEFAESPARKAIEEMWVRMNSLMKKIIIGGIKDEYSSSK